MKKILKVIFSLVIFCGLILLLPFNSLASEPEIIDPYDNLKTENAQKYQTLLQNYKETHQKIIKELEYAIENSTDIVKLLQESYNLGELIKSNKKPAKYNEYEERQNKINDLLFEKYGTAINSASVYFLDFKIEKTPRKKIETELNDAKSIYVNTLDCFENGIYSKSTACEKFRRVCESYGSDEGNMYYYELTEGLELKKINASENGNSFLNLKDSRKKHEHIIQNDIYQFCRLLSKTASPFAPKHIREHSVKYVKFIDGFYGSVLPFSSHFGKICLDKKPSEERIARLVKIKNEYPDDLDVKLFSSDYDKWQSACDKAAQQVCKNTYM